MKVIKRLFIVLFILLIVLLLGLYGFIFALTNDAHKPYMDLVEKYSEQNNLEKELTLAIIKTESSFKEGAVSNMGAEGLMQIIPETAKWVSEQLDEEYDPEKIFDPETNIKYGTFYLKYLINHFKSIDYAIIAYNAGLGNVQNWINEGILTGSYSDYDNIPINEAKNYIKKVKDQYRLNKKIYDVYYADLESSRAKRAFNTFWKLTTDMFN